MNDLIHTNLLGDSHTAFIRQVTTYLDTLERGVALTMRRKPKLGAHEIQVELKKVIEEAYRCHRLRFRVLDYLACSDQELDGLVEWVGSLIQLIRSLMSGTAAPRDVRLREAARKLQDIPDLPHAPLDIYRTDGPEPLNLYDYVGYQEGVRRADLCALQVDQQKLRTLFRLIPISQSSRKPALISTLTQAQIKAYRRLEFFLRLKETPCTFGGISARPIPLLLGPSGVGKSALVHAFAEDLLKKRGHSLPVYSTSGPTFIPDGARHEPYTLMAIRDWMRSEVRSTGIIFIDEIDKLAVATRNDYNQSVLGCLYELLDSRLDSHPDWSEGDCQRLANIMLVGAATFQSQQCKAMKNIDNVARRGARLEQIEAESEIPQELLFRFNASTIYIDAPFEREIQERIADIHRDLGTAAPCASKIAKLATRAAASNRQLRWLEAYLSLHLERKYQMEASEQDQAAVEQETELDWE
jgi:hypothetical protein